MADTAALVIALSAQLTKFEKDLQKAGVIAEKSVKDIEGKFEKMNPKVSTSFFGNLFANMADKAISGAIDGVKQLADRFKELEKTAELTGLSLQWLYGLQEAGSKAGASVGEVNSAVERLAFALDEMQRGGDNALKTLLDANPQFLKGASRDALDLSQTLKIVADILANAKNNVQAMDIGRNLGLPDNVVRAWQQGGDAVEKIALQSAKAAPDLERMAAMAKLLSDAWSAFADKATSGAIEGAFIYLNYLATAYLAVLEAILPALQAINTQAGDIVATAVAGLKSAQSAIAAAREGKGGTPVRVQVPMSGGGRAVDPFAKRNAAGAESAFDRQSDQITKHIALMEADTKAVGKNVGEQERLRTEALLKTAAERDGLTVTAEMTAKIEQQSIAAGEAALRLAQARHQMAEINDASREFGSALSEGFKAAVLEGKKLDEVLKNLTNRLASKAIDQMFNLIFAAPAGGGNSIFASLLSGIGTRAGGGPVSAGSPYLVGEHGPELMVPNQSGMVVPNQAIGRTSRGLTVAPVYNIDASGADTAAVARLQAALVATNRSLEARALAAVSSHMARGA